MRHATLALDTAKKIVPVVLFIGLVVVGAYLAYLVGEWLWWRLSNYVVPETPTERKDLLNVFVLIVGGVVAFLTALAAIGNLWESRRTLEQQRKLDERKAQEDALQAYYEQMGALLTKHKLAEIERADDPVRLLAHAQTQTVLRRVDATRKGVLVRFLSGAQLITGDKPIVHLGPFADLSNTDHSGAYLKGANLSGAYLNEANFTRADLSNTHLSNANLIAASLKGADLSDADLNGANLRRAELSDANLSDADLRDAELSHADLSGANFKGANLSHADLNGANFTHAKLSGVNLSGVNLMDASLKGADLSHADLRDANLRDATLNDAALMEADLNDTNLIVARFKGADLSHADLSGADFSDANFIGADLRGANLRDARFSDAHFSDADLSGATLPNGQKYEDWLQTQEGSGNADKE